MKTELEIYTHKDRDIYFRPGTSDLNVLKEVLEQRAYRSVKHQFDVDKGEHWLDLGANIGAFTIYCLDKGASVTAFEPNKNNFTLLFQNCGDEANIQNSCVSDSKKYVVELFSSSKNGGNSRFNLIPNCKKLVLEYHFSKDNSLINFKRRLKTLEKILSDWISS